MLCRLLAQARSESERGITGAVDAIMALKSENLGAFLTELLEVAKKREPESLHLAIVLITSCLNENEQRTMPVEYYEAVCQAGIELMRHEKDEVAYAAAMMFGISACFLLRDNTHLNLIEWLRECLAVADAESFVHNVLKAIKEILKTVMIESSAVNLLVSECMRHLSNPRYCLDVLEIVAEMEDTFVERTTAEVRAGFIETLMQLSQVSELKKTCYDCWSVLISSCPNECRPVLERVCLLVAHDLHAQSDTAVLFSCLRCVETLFVMRLQIQQDFFDFQVFDCLFEPIVAVMGSISIDVPDEPDAWEPYIAAFSCLAIMTKTFPVHACDVLLATMLKSWQSPAPVMREICLFFAKLIIKYTEKDINFDLFLNLVSQCVRDMNARVRYRSLAAISMLMKYIENGDEWQQKVLPEMLVSVKSCLQDHPLNVDAAMDALVAIYRRVSVNEGELLPLFFELSCSPNDVICASALDHIQEIIASMENVTGIIEPAINLMKQSFERHPLRTFQDYLVEILNTLIERAGEPLTPFIEQIWTLLMASGERMKLIPLGAMASHYPSAFSPYLSRTAQYILEAFQSCEDETDVLLSCSAIQSLATSEICPMSEFASALLAKAATELSDKSRANIIETISILYVNCSSEMVSTFQKALEAVVHVVAGIADGSLKPKSGYFTGCFRLLNFVMSESDDVAAKKEMAALSLSLLQHVTPPLVAKWDETQVDVVLDVLLTMASDYLELVLELYHSSPCVTAILTQAEQFEELNTPASLFRKILNGEEL